MVKKNLIPGSRSERLMELLENKGNKMRAISTSE